MRVVGSEIDALAVAASVIVEIAETRAEYESDDSGLVEISMDLDMSAVIRVSARDRESRLLTERETELLKREGVVTVRLRHGRPISGRVIDGDTGMPIADAQVRATRVDATGVLEFDDLARSSKSGQFLFPGVPTPDSSTFGDLFGVWITCTCPPQYRDGVSQRVSIEVGDTVIEMHRSQ